MRPSVRLRPRSASASVGESVTFTCDVSGDPLPTVHWETDLYGTLDIQNSPPGVTVGKTISMFCCIILNLLPLLLRFTPEILISMYFQILRNSLTILSVKEVDTGAVTCFADSIAGESKDECFTFCQR